jgi:hypothetical protein
LSINDLSATFPCPSPLWNPRGFPCSRVLSVTITVNNGKEEAQSGESHHVPSFSPNLSTQSPVFNTSSTRFCDVCKVDVKIGFGGEANWNIHTSGAAHRRNKSSEGTSITNFFSKASMNPKNQGPSAVFQIQHFHPSLLSSTLPCTWASVHLWDPFLPLTIILSLTLTIWKPLRLNSRLQTMSVSC